MVNNMNFYHIYPLGFCDAPEYNDGKQTHRIKKIEEWIDHLSKLEINALYLGPVFESDKHGYDIRDYQKIDCRLGDDKDMKHLTKALHQKNIQVIFDGVFNHVGRGFFAFQDVLAHKEASAYKDWFYIDFYQNQNEDGFSYANWEGHPELVKLNLENDAVVNYLFESIKKWIDVYQIDGLRLDVAYCLNKDFLWKLHHFVKGINPDFFLLGEMIHGDYNQLLNDGLLDSVTNYECRKGLFSSFNSQNLFEISYSLNRQFGKDSWCLYTGKPLFNFVDNHDVDRIASILNDERDLTLIYALLYAMPGMPCIYYGSEWGAKGQRTNTSDVDLRPSYQKPEWNDLTTLLKELGQLRKEMTCLQFGSYENVVERNQQLLLKRADDHHQLLFAVNIQDEDISLPLSSCKLRNLLTSETLVVENDIYLPKKSFAFYLID